MSGFDSLRPAGTYSEPVTAATPGQALTRWRSSEIIEVDAARLTPDNLDELWQSFESKPHYDADRNVDGLAVYADHGREVALFGEWICRRVDDGLPFTLADAEFRRRYEPADAAQDARPAPGDASAIVDGTVKEWLDRRTATALATAPGIDDREQGKRQGIEQLRYLHLDDYWYVLTPAVLAALGKEPKPAPELAAAAAPEVDQLEDQIEDLLEQLGVLQDRIGNLAAGLKLSADASRPSKKSDIEDGCAAALLGILDPR